MTAPHSKPKNQIERQRIVGTAVSNISTVGLLELIARWLSDGNGHYVVFRDVHGVIRARSDPQLRAANEGADIVAPDGMPLVWAARAAGATTFERVCGPDFLLAACRYGLSRGWRHYFYGGAPGVADAVASTLAEKFPGLIVVGTQSPPFRPLTPQESEQSCAAIRTAQPHLVWVGLGTPKQEIWMAAHCRDFAATLLGVGAAFDIYAGLVRRAPEWAQKHGLEWGYRLLSEPTRLWRRYLIFAPLFVLLAAGEIASRFFWQSFRRSTEKV